MTIIGEAFVALRPISTGFAPEATKQVESSLAGVAKGALGLVGAGLAVGGLAKAIKDASAAARDNTRSDRLLEAAVKATGGSAHITAASIEELSKSQSLKIGIDAVTIKSADTLLLRFRNVRNELGANNDVFTRTTAAAADLAAGLGKNLSSATFLLGKALNDPVRGMNLLRRAGVQLTTQQQAQVKSFVAANNVLGAQKVVLDAVSKSFAGAAQAAVGPFGILKVTLHELEVQLGTAINPVLKSFAQVLIDVLPTLANAFVPALVDLGKSLAEVVHAAEPAIAIFARLSGDVLSAIASALAGIASVLDKIPGPAIETAAAFGTIIFIGSKLLNALQLMNIGFAVTVANAAKTVPALEGVGAAALTAGEEIGTGIDLALGPLGLLAAGVGALLIGFGLFGNDAPKVATAAIQINDALLKVGNTLGSAAQEALDFRDAFGKALVDNQLGDFSANLLADGGKIIGQLHRIGVSTNDLADQFQGGKVGAKAFATEILRASGSLPKFQGFLALTGKSVDQFLTAATNKQKLLGDLTRFALTEGNLGAAAAIQNIGKQVKAFADLQRAYETDARTKLVALQGAGKLTAADELQLAAIRKLPPAQRDYIALLNQINAEQADAVQKAKDLAAANGVQAGTWDLVARSLLQNGFALDKLPPKLQKVTAAFDKKALDSFVKSLKDALDTLTKDTLATLPKTATAFSDYTDSIKTAYGNLVTAVDNAKSAAEKAGSATTSLGDASSNAAAKTQARIDADRSKLAAANAAFAASTADSANSAAKKVASAQQKLNDDLAASATSGATSITNAHRKVTTALAGSGDAAKKVKEAQDALIKAVDPKRLVENLQQQATDIARFNENILKLFRSGNERLALEALRLGPAFAAGLAGATPQIQAATNNALLLVDRRTGETSALVNRLGKQMLLDLGGAAAQADGTIAFNLGDPSQSKAALKANLRSIVKSFGAFSPEFAQAAQLVGTSALRAYLRTLGAFEPGTKKAIHSTAVAIRLAIPDATASTAALAAAIGNSLDIDTRNITTKTARALVAVSEAVKAAQPGITSDVAAAAEQIVGPIITAFGGVPKVGSDNFAILTNELVQSVPGLTAAGARAILAINSGAKSVLSTLSGTAAAAASSVSAPFADPAKRKKGSDDASTFSGQIAAAARAPFTAAAAKAKIGKGGDPAVFAEGLIQKLVDALDGGTTKAQTAAARLVTKTMSVFGTPTGPLGPQGPDGPGGAGKKATNDLADGITKNIAGAVTAATTAGAKVGKAFSGSVADAITTKQIDITNSAISTTILALSSGAPSPVNVAAARGKVIGSAFVGGIISGIASAVPLLVAAASAAADAAAKAVRKHLGISSPSKVFRIIGTQAVQGLALGLGDDLASIAKASSALAEAATPPPFSISPPQVGTTVPPPLPSQQPPKVTLNGDPIVRAIEDSATTIVQSIKLDLAAPLLHLLNEMWITLRNQGTSAGGSGGSTGEASGGTAPVDAAAAAIRAAVLSAQKQTAADYARLIFALRAQAANAKLPPALRDPSIAARVALDAAALASDQRRLTNALRAEALEKALGALKTKEATDAAKLAAIQANLSGFSQAQVDAAKASLAADKAKVKATQDAIDKLIKIVGATTLPKPLPVSVLPPGPITGNFGPSTLPGARQAPPPIVTTASSSAPDPALVAAFSAAIRSLPPTTIDRSTNVGQIVAPVTQSPDAAGLAVARRLRTEQFLAGN